MRRTCISIVLFVLVLCALPAAAVMAATVNVSMNNFAFSPQSITVNVGDTVIWTNSSSTSHTSTSGSNCTSDGTWDSGTVNAGGTFSFTFNQAGTFPYFCIPHCSIGMTGTVVVNSSSSNSVDFSAVPTSGIAPLNVSFTPSVTGTVTAYSWDFGDGSTSTQQNPTHSYSNTGNFSVTLSVTFADGTSLSQSKSNYITVSSTNSIDFSGTPTSGTSPLNVSFTPVIPGTIAATAYSWNFGDGSTSTQQNPTHIYSNTGNFDVTLSVTLVDGTSLSQSKSNYITVSNANGVDFSAIPTSGTTPLNVSFTPSVTGTVTTYSWDFGDGVTGTQSLPTHTYGSTGTYNVSLTVTLNDGSSQTTTKNNFISVSLAGPSSSVWQDFFAVDTRETPMAGDFNGDGRTDIITFTRNNSNAFGDVYVSLSDGTEFGTPTKWNDFFAIDQDQVVVIGDFNGDHIDDIATWLQTTTQQVYVATSFGSGMNTSTVWLNSIGTGPDDILEAADVNGDGKVDLVLFARSQGKVYVALSNGNSFDAPQVWHNFFAVSSFERPEVGDVNGDGMADIITFSTNSSTAFGDVYVALSTGSQFSDKQSSDKWNDFFAIDPAQIIRIGDLNGDGLADFLTFLPAPNTGQVYAVYSRGSFMSDNFLWTQNFQSGLSTDLPFAGDVNGDGKADLIVFRQSEGQVYVAVTP